MAIARAACMPVARRATHAALLLVRPNLAVMLVGRPEGKTMPVARRAAPHASPRPTLALPKGRFVRTIRTVRIVGHPLGRGCT